MADLPGEREFMNYHGKTKRAKKICRPFCLPGITHHLPENSSWPNHRLKVRQKIWTRKEAKIGVLRQLWVGGAKAGKRRANTGTVKYGLGWLFWSKYSCGKAVVKQTRLPPPVPPPVPPTQKLVPVSPIQKPVTEPPF